MPRTRAQRRHALATALDGDSVSHVLSFLPKLGVVPGRLYTLSGSGTQHTCGGLSLKAILAPRRRRLIKCPGDIPRLENAVAAAREGDVVLLTESVELQAPIVAPPVIVAPIPFPIPLALPVAAVAAVATALVAAGGRHVEAGALRFELQVRQPLEHLPQARAAEALDVDPLAKVTLVELLQLRGLVHREVDEELDEELDELFKETALHRPLLKPLSMHWMSLTAARAIPYQLRSRVPTMLMTPTTFRRRVPRRLGLVPEQDVPNQDIQVPSPGLYLLKEEVLRPKVIAIEADADLRPTLFTTCPGRQDFRSVPLILHLPQGG